MSRIASPSARRVTFTGIMAVPDDFGRIRVILMEKFANGHYDTSWSILRRELPKLNQWYSVPYELHPPMDDETRGIAHVTVPKRHKKYWDSIATSLLGKEVQIEATIRPFRFANRSGEYTTGVSLDLASLILRSEVAAL